MSDFSILGCRVDAIGRAEAIERIEALAHGHTPAQVVTLGVEMIMYAQRDRRFRALLERSALSVCDTIGILLVSRLRGGPLRERVTGADLIEPLAERAARNKTLRFYFVGGAPGVAERAAAVLRARYPAVDIVGVRDGYFSAAESFGVAAAIAQSGANILLVGLGSPKQEFWLEEHLASTGCGVGIGVGGSFDVLAGAVPRAPRSWQRLGLEWLYRLVREPSRWRRQLALPRFAVAATREAIGLRGTKTR
jgi:N-acetylglucosaminyldiphosphoundecaprenol N-acetyl-beta-D-mannosaminyltransferase